MNTIQLLESLKDISTSNTLYHHTNIKALLSILRDGFLRGSEYPSNTIKDNPKKVELATMRKATKTNPKVYKNLSGSIGNVEIVLFVDRIKSSVRGASVKPIAELPQDAKKNLLKSLSFLPADTVKVYIDSLEKTPSPKLEKLIKNTFGELGNNKHGFPISKNILIKSKTYKSSLADRREGEERIGLDKNTHLPVKPELLQIKILSDFKKDWTLYTQNFIWKKQDVAEYLSLLKKYKSSFVVDNNYNSLVEVLEKLKTVKTVEEALNTLQVKDKYDREEIIAANS